MKPRKFFLFLFLIFGYLFLRLRLISTFPLFFDEAIYLHWGLSVNKDWDWKFVSLIDGKQPLFIWLTSFFLKIISDPLIGGRLVSLVAGIFSLLGIYYLSEKLFSKRTAIIASVLYIIVPFYVLYDSLALMDALLLALSVWSVIFTVRLFQKPCFKEALILGIIIGLGLLTKSSASFFLYLLPLAFLFNSRFNLVLLLVVLVEAKLIESVLRFSIYYSVVAGKNQEFVRSFAELLRAKPEIYLQNFQSIFGWLINYLSLPVVLLSLLFFSDRQKLKYSLYLFLYGLIPILVMVFIGKQLYPRHFLFMSWPFLILVANCLVKIQNKLVLSGLLLLVLYLPLKTDYYLLTRTYLKAGLPEIENWQFFTGMPSGIGISELYSFFDQRKDKDVLIITDRSIGILADGLTIRYFNNPKIKIKGVDGVKKEDLPIYLDNKKYAEIYLALSWQVFPDGINANKVLEVTREGENNNWRVYELR